MKKIERCLAPDILALLLIGFSTGAAQASFIHLPDIDPADFVSLIANPHSPPELRTTFVYEAQTEDEFIVNTGTVTVQAKGRRHRVELALKLTHRTIWVISENLPQLLVPTSHAHLRCSRSRVDGGVSGQAAAHEHLRRAAGRRAHVGWADDSSPPEGGRADGGGAFQPFRQVA